MIFDNAPTDWHQLETLVAQAFAEMGCIATLDANIPKTRSESRIDVYVEDSTLSPPAVYLCECKYWNRPVSKHVVQQFRTVISDSGANLGIIISKKGFQNGAVEEAEYTNIRLYSWQDFQEAFEQRWTITMTERFRKLAHECSDLSFEAYHMDSSQEGYRLTTDLDMNLLQETTLLCKVAGWEETVVEKCQSVRICETGPELTASQTDRWVELRTKREFYDFAIPLLEEHKRKQRKRLEILRTHPPK